MPQPDPIPLPPANTPEPPQPSPPEDPTPMLDVHPAHHAANTWRDFFIHIATIVLGLCIAVGLEQTVEYVHHRHQVADTREALRAERRNNIVRFSVQTEEFHRILPTLQTNLAIFQYIAQHPGVPQQQWPGKLHWWLYTFSYSDAAWKTAVQDNVLPYMPPAEVQRNTRLYQQLARLSDLMLQERAAIREAGAFSTSQPDPSRLTTEQIANEVRLMTTAINSYVAAANEQSVLSIGYPDFANPPTTAEIMSIRHWILYPEDVKGVDAEAAKVVGADRQERLETSDTSPQQ